VRAVGVHQPAGSRPRPQGRRLEGPAAVGAWNNVACDAGYTPTNDGKYTCDKGVLGPMVECAPSVCSNQPVPDHGRKGADWKDPLP